MDGRAEAPATAAHGSRDASASPKMPWVGIAANAGSGTGDGRRRVERLVAELERLGLRARVAWTLAERAALRLAAMIAAGRISSLDLGATCGRRFALMAGIGFDADVVTRHHVARMGRAGLPRPTNRGAYVESVLRSTFEYRFPPLTVSIEDPGAEETLVGSNAFLFNLPRYALGLPFAPLAQGDDGWLDLVVFRDPGAFSALRYLWMVLRGIHLTRPGVHHRKVRRVCVSSTETVPVQLDGDPGGHIKAEPLGSWTIEVLPGALDVLVPPAWAASA
jgi:diacylglycerol kinase family enzyme